MGWDEIARLMVWDGRDWCRIEQCERCGTSGLQSERGWDDTAERYTVPACVCQLCEGSGYLGLVPIWSGGAAQPLPPTTANIQDATA